MAGAWAVCLGYGHRTGSMNLLFVASRLPYPPIQGDRVRGYHFLRLLSREHRVTLVSPMAVASDRQAAAVVSGLCARWVPVPLRHWRAALHVGGSLLSSLPLQSLYFCPPMFRQQVDALCRAEAFDLVHVQTARMTAAVGGVVGVPRVLDFIDALSLNMRRRALQESGLRRWFFQMEALRMARHEAAASQVFERMLISAPGDQAHIGFSERLHMVPNGVDLERFPYVEDGRDPNLIVFTGRMGYFPNADAACFFARQVLPRIRRRRADVRLVIVGADPSPQVRALAGVAGVAVLGYVPRVQAYLERAAVAIAPMRVGTGLQLKVLEAMASGAPLVVTPHVLGGIAAEPGVHVLVAEEAEVFAEQVLCLLGDSALRCQVARHARQLVEERYTWERAVRLLEDVYRLARAQCVVG